MSDGSLLISGYFDGTLADAELAELNAWIGADPEHAKLFAKHALLQSQVKDLGLPRPINGLVPIVEASFERPLTGRDRTTTGTVNPGLIWTGRRFQLGAEAMIPVNRASGRRVGAILQLHLYLDDLFPGSLGRPAW